MISTRVSLTKGWGERMAQRIERQVVAEMPRAAEEGARVASQAASARRRSGRMAQMETLPVTKTARGYKTGFRSKAFYSGFQSSGTLGSRRRKVSTATQRRRASSSGKARLAKLGGSGGIPALGHEEKGRAAMRRSMVQRINRM